MRSRRSRSRRLWLAAILLLSLAFGAGCGIRRTEPVVLSSDSRILQIENSVPVYDGDIIPWSEVEGWYLVSPGNVLDYLKWASDRKAERDARTVPN